MSEKGEASFRGQDSFFGATVETIRTEFTAVLCAENLVEKPQEHENDTFYLLKALGDGALAKKGLVGMYLVKVTSAHPCGCYICHRPLIATTETQTDDREALAQGFIGLGKLKAFKDYLQQEH